jgi:GH25 family lysozyme M1 (1,4-beta-N-acetylmuramidase)
MRPDRRTFLASAAALAAHALSPGRAAAQTTGLPGIDVSHWQGTINWTQVKNSGVVFAFCKATENTDFTDPRFSANWSAMKSLGIVRGAYHYARYLLSPPVEQARFFVDTVRPQAGDLPLVIDTEESRNEGATPAQVWAWLQACVAEIKRLTGKAPIIYTRENYWRIDVGNPADNLGCPLWTARWNPDPFTPFPLPRAWGNWNFWQYRVAPAGTVPGISGEIDQDFFNGTLSQLKKLAFTATPTPRR